MTPFDFVDTIMTHSKKNLMEEDPQNEKEYNSFIINRHLSYFPESVLYAEDMNLYPLLDDKLKYEYLLNSVRPQKKRFVKWHKSERSSDLEAIAQYFDFSIQKAKEAVKVLSKEQVNDIKRKLIKGGVK